VRQREETQREEAALPADSSESDSRANASGSQEADRDDVTGPADSTEDDVRRKFREALDKQAKRAAGSSGRTGDPTDKFHGAHGPAATRRTFRRKSG
jgi:Family of unknown function (DUF5302)